MTVRLFLLILLAVRLRISQTGGGNPKGPVTNLLFGHNFHDNCMKMKEIGPGVYPLGSANDLHLINETDFCYTTFPFDRMYLHRS